MAVIHIKGCGRCSNSKGCQIKKDFRNLASKQERYKEYEYHDSFNDSFHSSKILNEFNLKCPFVDRKYKDGDNVIFTLGIQRYTKITHWDCDRDCDYCGDSKKCNDGVITFENVRYKKYEKVSGKILSLYKNDKWVVGIDGDEWSWLSNLCNKSDLEFFERITGIYDPMNECRMVFVTKEKFITK